MGVISRKILGFDPGVISRSVKRDIFDKNDWGDCNIGRSTGPVFLDSG